MHEKHAIQLSTNEIETLKREKDRIEAQMVSSISETAQARQLLEAITQKTEKDNKAADAAIEKM